MLHVILQCYMLYYNVTCYATCYTTMLHVILQCYMLYYNATCYTTMLHVILQCYMLYYNATCYTTMLHVILRMLHVILQCYMLYYNATCYTTCYTTNALVIEYLLCATSPTAQHCTVLNFIEINSNLYFAEFATLD